MDHQKSTNTIITTVCVKIETTPHTTYSYNTVLDPKREVCRILQVDKCESPLMFQRGMTSAYTGMGFPVLGFNQTFTVEKITLLMHITRKMQLCFSPTSKQFVCTQINHFSWYGQNVIFPQYGFKLTPSVPLSHEFGL